MTKKDKEKIMSGLRLTHSTPKIIGEEIVVLFEAMFSDKDGVKENVTIDFYDDYPKIPKNSALTNDEGKAYYEYRKKGLENMLSTKTIRAQVKGTPIESTDSVELRPDYGTGFMKRYRFFKRNLENHGKKIIKHLIISSLIFLPALIALYVMPETVGMFIGFIGGGIYFYLKREENLKKASTIWLLSMISGMALMYLPTNVLTFGIIYAYFFGNILFLAEELTYEISYQEYEGKVKMVWEKWINFYPTAGIIIALLFIGFNILSIFAETIKGPCDIYSAIFGAKAALTQITGPGIDLSNEVVGSGTALSIMIKDIWIDTFDIISWIVGALLLGISATPEELIEMFKKKEGGISLLRVFEKTLFIKEISDLVRRRKP